MRGSALAFVTDVTWAATSIGLALLLPACGATAPSPPAVGSLRVITATTGSQLDPDGYSVSVGGQVRSIGANDSITIDQIPAGSVRVELGGVEFNCSLTTPQTVDVVVASGSVARTAFAVGCMATTGTIRVASTTSGRNIDPDGYTLSLNGIPQGTVAVTGVRLFPGLAPGVYSVVFGGAAENCELDTPTATATVTAGAETTVSLIALCTAPLRNVIVFPNAVSNGSRLSAVNTDGSGLQVLSSLTELAKPEVSPDGLEIAYLDHRPAGQTLKLYVMRNDGGGIRPVVTTGEYVEDVRWTPDGRLVFTQPPVFNSWPDVCQVSADGTGLSCAAPEGGNIIGGQLSLSPDGKRMVQAAGSDFVFMNVDGTNYQVVSNTGTGMNYDADWSPDGQHVVYKHVEDIDGDGQEEFDIYVMDVDGTNPTRLTTDAAIHKNPRWSPDGQQILFVSSTLETDGNPELKVMDADGSHVHKLTPNGHDEGPGSWSPK
jgi:WD40 repeat protein